MIVLLKRTLQKSADSYAQKSSIIYNTSPPTGEDIAAAGDLWVQTGTTPTNEFVSSTTPTTAQSGDVWIKTTSSAEWVFHEPVRGLLDELELAFSNTIFNVAYSITYNPTKPVLFSPYYTADMSLIVEVDSVWQFNGEEWDQVPAWIYDGQAWQSLGG